MPEQLYSKNWAITYTRKSAHKAVEIKTQECNAKTFIKVLLNFLDQKS